MNICRCFARQRKLSFSGDHPLAAPNAPSPGYRRDKGYSPALCITGGTGITPPEICDAIRKAATTAGTVINLRN